MLSNFMEDMEDAQQQANLGDYLGSYREMFSSSNANYENQVSVFTPDGRLILSSETDWRALDFKRNKQIMGILGSDGTTALYSPAPIYIDQMVVFTTRKIVDPARNLDVVMVWTATSSLFRNSLISSQAFFPTAESFFLTNAGEVLDSYANMDALQSVPDSGSYQQRLMTIIRDGGLNKATRFASYDETTPVIGAIRWMPELQLGYVLQVPEQAIYSQVPVLSSFNLILLGFTLVLSGIVAVIATRSFITPLLQLAQLAHDFTQGEWEKRAHFKRKDEIGQLANALDRMVDELTGLYHSMEQKVAERTEQVRLASEVAVLATSANSQSEIINRTVELVVERFHYLYAGIFLINSSGMFAELEQENQREPTGKTLFDQRLRLGADSLVGWVGANNQAGAITDSSETSYTQSTLLPGARSEAAIPIILGNQVVAVLDVQSENPETFDNDTLSALQSLSNQMASGMQNASLLETAEVNLAETSMLYRTSRQITQAESEERALTLLKDAIAASIYVSGVYELHEDHIRAVAIYDAKNPASVNSMEGLTLPLKQVPEQFNGPGYIRIDDISTLTPFDHILSFYLRRGCRGAVLFPIFEAGALTKIIILGEREIGQLNEAAIQPFANLIDVAASVLSRFRILKELEERLAELEALEQLSHHVSEETQLADLVSAFRQQSARVAGGLEFAIGIHNQQARQMEFPFVFNELGEKRSPEPFTLGAGLINTLMESRQPVLLNRMAKRVEDLSIKIFGKPAQSWLGIPLVVDGKSIGALLIQDARGENRFREQDVKLFGMMAATLAIWFKKAQLVADLKEALDAFQQEQFLLSSWLMNTPDFAYFKDRAGRYIRAGRRYALHLGKSSPDQLIGMTDYELYDPETALEREKEDQALLESRQAEIGEIHEEADENGQVSWRLRSRTPMIDKDNRLVGLLSISRNVTEMKKTEEMAQQAARQLTTASEIARDASGTLELSELLNKAVNLVRERFGFYHASIFLIDLAGIYAVLRESTGEVGRTMKERGHKLAIGSRSIVGQSTMLGEPLVINDVTHDPNYYANPLLPETRAELSIPLKVGAQVLGALDVQSREAEAYGEQEVTILKLLADQIAVAVMNANLYSRSMENLEQHRQLHEITTKAASATTSEEVLEAAAEGLRGALNGAAVSVYLTAAGLLKLQTTAGYGLNESPPSAFRPGEGPVGRMMQERHALLLTGKETDAAESDDPYRSHIAAPILYSGELVGVLHAASPEVSAFDENTLDLLGLLANSLGAILSNTQLISTVRKQVDRQQLIYEATSRIHRSVDIQTILETSASEIARAVGARRTQIKIAPEAAQPGSESDGSLNGNGSGHAKNGKEILK